MGNDIIAEVVRTRLRSRGGSIKGGYTDTEAKSVLVFDVRREAYLHNHENSNKDGCKTRPGDPRELLELTYTCANSDHNGCNDREVVGTQRMVGKRVECCRHTYHS
jgi:hypothetical protein